MAWRGSSSNKDNKQETSGNKPPVAENKNEAQTDGLVSLVATMRAVCEGYVDAKVEKAVAELEIVSLKATVDKQATRLEQFEEKYVPTKQLTIVGAIACAIIVPLLIYIYQTRNSELDKKLEHVEASMSNLPTEDRVLRLLRSEQEGKANKGSEPTSGPRTGPPSAQP